MSVLANLETTVSNPGADPQTHVRRGFIWKVSLIAGLGGILYGFDMGVIAAALIFVRETFSLSTRMEEVVGEMKLAAAWAKLGRAIGVVKVGAQ